MTQEEILLQDFERQSKIHYSGSHRAAFEFGAEYGYKKALADIEEAKKIYCICSVHYRNKEEIKRNKCEDCQGLLKLDE